MSGKRFDKTTNRASNSENKRRYFHQSQEVAEGNLAFERSLNDLRSCSNLSKERSKVNVTVVDTHDVLVNGTPIMVNPCDDPCSSAIIGANYQTPSQRDIRTADCRASFSDIGGMMSQIQTVSEPPLIRSRLNRAVGTHVQTNNTHHRNTQLINVCENNNNQPSKLASRTFISRKSISLATSVSETIDTDAYSFVISESDCSYSKYQDNFKIPSLSQVKPSLIRTHTKDEIPEEIEKKVQSVNYKLPLKTLPQRISDSSYCTSIRHDEPNKSLDTIDENKFDVFRIRYNCALPEERLNGPPSGTNSTGDECLETYQSRTIACLKENVCDNKRDPTIEKNTFDPSKFTTTKGARPRLERRKNRTHTSSSGLCYSESDREGSRQVDVSSSSSLSRSLDNRPTSGHDYECYYSKPVTISKTHMLGLNDIACRITTTTTALLAGGSDCISDGNTFQLNNSGYNIRSKKRKSHFSLFDEGIKSLIGTNDSILQNSRRLFKTVSTLRNRLYPNINKPESGFESGTVQLDEKLGIHVSEHSENPVDFSSLANNENRKLTEDNYHLNLGMFFLFLFI